jgi:hypothetical protein
VPLKSRPVLSKEAKSAMRTRYRAISAPKVAEHHPLTKSHHLHVEIRAEGYFKIKERGKWSGQRRQSLAC